MSGTFIFTNALRDFLRMRRLVAWFVVALALMVLSLLFLGVFNAPNKATAYSMISTLLLFRVLPLASAIFSAAVIGQEIEQKTIVYLVTRPVERWRLILMRTLASAVAVSLVTTVAMVFLSIAVFGNPFANQLFFRDLLAILLGSLAYGGLFVYVTLILSKLSMLVCLLFAFAWETAVPQLPGSMSMLSVSTYLSAIAERPAGISSAGFFGKVPSALGSPALSAQTGWIVIVLMILFFGGLNMWWFSTFEYIPREDGE
jgi:ABC-2 type transport system permease protein